MGDNKISNFFIHYFTSCEFSKITSLDKDDLILYAMRSKITFYYALKSEKRITYHPTGKIKGQLGGLIKLFRSFVFPFKLDHREYDIGQIITIQGTGQLNLLGKNRLTEFEVLGYCQDTESGIIAIEKVRNKFHPIYFKDILFSVDSLAELKELIIQEAKDANKEDQYSSENAQQPSKKSKQAQRETIFLDWLADKKEIEVSCMKKEDVWAELQKLDHVLFSVESKNFFRDQKIITFKSGRKSISEH